MRIETRVARVAGRREACQALVICVGHDMTPQDDDAETVHALAGEGMTTACAALGQLAIGSAVSTPALDLPAHTVFYVLAPRDTADLGAEDHLRQAMRAILRLAGEHDVRSLAMPALGAGRIRARNHVAAAIIVKALLEDAPRLAPQLQKVTICLPSMALLFGFSKAQQLNDPDDRRPKRMDVAVRDLIDTLPPARFAEQHRRYAGGAAPELTLSNDEIQ